jgi:hypothetical protein
MIRPFTCVCMLTAGASGLYLYQAKHRAQLLDRQITATMHLVDQARERTEVLRAQWTLKSDPQRLEVLAARFLPLKTTQPSQFTTMAELDNRLPPVRAVPSHEGTTDEPTPEPSNTPLATAEPAAPAAPAAKPAPPAEPVVTAAARPAPAPPPRPVAHAAPLHPIEHNLAEAHPAERHPTRDLASALGYARTLANAAPPATAPVPMLTPVSGPLLVRPAPGYAPRAYTPPAYTPRPYTPPAYAPTPAAAAMPAPVTGSALGMARALPPAGAPSAAMRYGN